MKSIMYNAALEAGKVILKHYNNIGNISFKKPRSIVTKADKLSEQKIMDIIGAKYPDHNFLTEESGLIRKKSDYTWVIDPIDGTTNYVAGIPQFAVSIGLAKNSKILMGLIYNPVSKDLYFSEEGKGSILNGKKIKVSRKTKLNDCVLGFNLPSTINTSQKTLSLISRKYGDFRSVRNFGSAALTVCYLAEGKLDAYFSMRISAWDIAAAKIILEEAGGKFTKLNGKPWSLYDRKVAGSNTFLHNKLINTLK
jgi:myo-inositol-1(or 4)-monophosphatase